jgi:tetratricopeptide (TPR) repeat protein
VRVWDAASGKELLTLQGHTDSVHGVSFSPDGRRLASAGDRTVRVWDAASGKELLTLQGHTDSVHCVSFSPDGVKLASGGLDRTVRVWDAASGKELLNLKGHTFLVRGVSFSPDGRRLASAGDQTVRVWDAATSRELLTFKLHTNGVSSVSFCVDGRRLASAGSDKTVLVWEASPVPDAVWRQRWMVSWVASLVEELISREEVLAVLREDPTLSESDRQFALQVAQGYPENSINHLQRLKAEQKAKQLNIAVWEVVKVRNASKNAYAEALGQAETAVRLAPQDRYILNTLGVAQYRVGRYTDALTTLTRSEKLRVTGIGSFPHDLAFLAMTQHQLGKKDEAKATLGRLREVMKQPIRAMNFESVDFLREAEELIAGKAKDMGP